MVNLEVVKKKSESFIVVTLIHNFPFAIVNEITNVMVGFIWGIEAPSKFLSRPQFIFLYFYSNALFSPKTIVLLTHWGGKSCLYAFSWLPVGLNNWIPFTAFSPNQTLKWFLLFHLSLTFWTSHNKTMHRNFSKAIKEKKQQYFKVFKYCKSVRLAVRLYYLVS